MTATTLKLLQLRFGHDPLAGPEINARQNGRLEGIDEMVAMLATRGQLVPLIVVEKGGLYFAADGNRRLAAMHKSWQPDAPVLVTIYPDAKSALEASIMANTSVPLHPVDRFRAYAEVIKRDKIDGAQLARRFGVSTKDMQRSLALGALADDVLDAWLAGAITADQAKAFTLADKATQAKVLAAALKNGPTSPYSIRQMILGKRRDVGNLIAFVGVEAYRKAGGKLDEDLFGIHHIAHNPEIAVKLANAKLDEECDKLTAAGWAWAERHESMPSGWSITYGRLDEPKNPKLSDADAKARAALLDGDPDVLQAFDSVMAAKAYKPDKMKTAGCVLSITLTGHLFIAHGVVMPEKKKAAKPEPKERVAKKAKKPVQISARLASDLIEVRNRAIQGLVAALPPKKLVAAIRKEFDADDYFDRLPVAMVGPAVAEMGITMAANIKQKALIATAKSQAKKTGWLPPELRTAGYENPKTKGAVAT